MPITWHSSRYWDWRMPKDEKKTNKQKDYGHKHRLFLYLMTGYKKLFDLKRNKNKDEPFSSASSRRTIRI